MPCDFCTHSTTALMWGSATPFSSLPDFWCCQAGDIFRQGIAVLIKRQAWPDAVSLLMRFGEACDKGSALNSQAKAYLGAVVVWLYAGEPKQAWQVSTAVDRLPYGRHCQCGSHSEGCLHGPAASVNKQGACEKQQSCTRCFQGSCSSTDLAVDCLCFVTRSCDALTDDYSNIFCATHQHFYKRGCNRIFVWLAICGLLVYVALIREV